MSTTGSDMAPAFDDLVALQRTVDDAHHRLQQLSDVYGRSSVNAWSEEQRAAWHAARNAWVEDVAVSRR
ncbi:hypothetical protein ACFY3O_36355 [Streptomyces sp. NPDC001046]|uniref:hypothetical protein n=1 Tax=Streptomyces sp. NPDC001046 TaxID=3364543 RepID=UPI00367CBA70